MVPRIMAQGFTVERYPMEIHNFVPYTSVSNFKKNVNNVQDGTTWNWDNVYHLSKYAIMGSNKTFMMNFAYTPIWLSVDGTKTGLPSDWGVWTSIITQMCNHLKMYASVKFIEI
ncbi:MAG: hypothetical protein WDW38_007859 [Sanguina aurantia]